MTKPTQEELRRSGLCHLAGLGGLLLPLANFIFPLVLWSFWRQSSTFVEGHGREAVNFQFTMVLLGGSFIPIEFFVVHSAVDPLAALSLAVLTALGLVVYGGVLSIRAATRAFRGDSFAYPHSLRVF